MTTVPEQRIVLHDVSWETYERLLTDQGDRAGPRLTYDRGELEVLSPSAEHERDNRTLALLIEEVAIELGIEVSDVGSTAFKRQDLERGFEPDSSFYIRHEGQVRGQTRIELAVDPPPDLVIEIEITRSALPKLPIYASLGVPEVWRWDGETLTILHLVSDAYVERSTSAALPALTSEVLTRFMTEARSARRTDWVRRIREWARGRRQDAD
jgi:Uma2 family endonuclease